LVPTLTRVICHVQTMTVFSGKQVVPVDYESEVSQRLLEASLSGDLKSALECIADPFIDVNYIGAVCLKSRKSEVVLNDESASEVSVDYQELKTDVTALFLAVHAGNVALVKKLLVMSELVFASDVVFSVF